MSRDGLGLRYRGAAASRAHLHECLLSSGAPFASALRHCVTGKPVMRHSETLRAAMEDKAPAALGGFVIGFVDTLLQNYVKPALIEDGYLNPTTAALFSEAVSFNTKLMFASIPDALVGTFVEKVCSAAITKAGYSEETANAFSSFVGAAISVSRDPSGIFNGTIKELTGLAGSAGGTLAALELIQRLPKLRLEGVTPDAQPEAPETKLDIQSPLSEIAVDIPGKYREPIGEPKSASARIGMALNNPSAMRRVNTSPVISHAYR